MRSNVRISESASLWLDFFRGLAALEVLSGHLFAMVFGELPRPLGITGYLTGAIGVLSSKSHQAVIIFFALSGFLVGGPFLIKAVQRQANPRSYVIARTTRLWTVVVPTLVLTVILDRSLPQAFVSARPFFFPDAIQHSWACNLAFLQTLYCAPFGTDGSLWSLSNEAFYYALWLCLVMRWWAPALVIVGVISLGPITDITGYFSFFGIWVAGAVAFMLEKRARWFGLLFPLVFAPQLVVSDIGLAAGFLALLISLDGVRFPFPKRPFHGLAEMSFSLYAVHLPVGISLLVVAGYVNPTARDWHGVLTFAWLMATTFAAAVCFYFAFERHTHKIRRRISGYYERRSVRPSPSGA